MEQHKILVAAPAEVTFDAMSELDLENSTFVRIIFRTRERLLRAKSETNLPRLGLVVQARRWGWGVLLELPEREIIFGAVTQPWVANPVFRALPPAEFVEFHEPGFVKIAWTLRAEPLDATFSIASTETRVTATDADARRRFRRYWALFSPGILLIRKICLRQVKAQAEHRAQLLTLSRAGNRAE